MRLLLVATLLRTFFQIALAGRGATPVAALTGGFRESDFLRAFTAYFTVTSAEKPGRKGEPPPPSQTGDESADGSEPQEIGDAKAKEEIEQQHAARRRAEEDAPDSEDRLIRALNNVASAMSSENFFAGRTPQRLGADIAATALLLRKGLIDQIIFEDDFASITERLWSVLFFRIEGRTQCASKTPCLIFDRVERVGWSGNCLATP